MGIDVGYTYGKIKYRFQYFIRYGSVELASYIYTRTYLRDV